MKALRDMTEPELKTLMDGIGRRIQNECESQQVESPLFMLLLFNDPQVAQYVCNCEREGAITAMRWTADRLEQRDVVERVNFNLRCGETGEFPEGKLHEHDRGELKFAIGSDKKIGKVLVTFGKPVAWIGMNKKTALDLSESLRWHAAKLGE